MQTAWRERNPQERVKGAKAAIEKNADCATAYILLAEEEAPTILESEKLLKQAMKAAESNLKKSQAQPHGGSNDSSGVLSKWLIKTIKMVFYYVVIKGNLILMKLAGRDINVLIYIKRRLAMCARKLGRLKEAVKMFRDVRVIVWEDYCCVITGLSWLNCPDFS